MSLLHLIFVALVWRTAAASGGGGAGTVEETGSLGFVKATQTSITMMIKDEAFQAEVSYKVTRDSGSIVVFPGEVLTAEKEVTDDKTPALTAATEYDYTLDMIHASKTDAKSVAKLCTAPENLKSVTEAKDGTTVTLTVVTADGKTDGLYIDELSAALETAPTLVKDGETTTATGTDASTTGTAKNKWQLKFPEAATASGTYIVTMASFPEPAPTYTVKPYYKAGCAAEAIGEAYSVANKVSMEAMFVYGVVGLMALILRALGLESYGLF